MGSAGMLAATPTAAGRIEEVLRDALKDFSRTPTQTVHETPSEAEGKGRGQENAPGGGSIWASAVDLTDLVSAAQGDPVLLSYYSVIREQIQRTANQRSWAPGQAIEGVIYVGFLLHRTGEVESVTVLADRSTASPTLQQAALEIVKASGPFPAFPPSFQESSKNLLVPIEFFPNS